MILEQQMFGEIVLEHKTLPRITFSGQFDIMAKNPVRVLQQLLLLIQMLFNKPVLRELWSLVGVLLQMAAHQKLH